MNCFLMVSVTFIFSMVHFFFFNDTATTEIYTLSLHDALPIFDLDRPRRGPPHRPAFAPGRRSEEHTSELQSRENLVCRLLLEKKKKTNKHYTIEKKNTSESNQYTR